MAEEDRARESAMRLRRLVDEFPLNEAERGLAGRCLRRLEQPLRMTVFGTDVGHAISLLNLMIGQPVISPEIKRARIQFVHGEEAHARLLFRDGSQKRIDGSDFRRLFDENPNRMRIYVDLPVLRKVSIMVAADRNPKALCADADKTLKASDIAIWAGSEFVTPMDRVWADMPDRLKDHSYFVPTPTLDRSSWAAIEGGFAGVVPVAPKRALRAKSGPDGVDKEAFREAGGMALVKMVKSEIDILLRSAIDAAEVLLIRHADALENAVQTAKPQTIEPEPDAYAEPVPDISAEAALEMISEMRPARTRKAISRGLAAVETYVGGIDELDTVGEFEDLPESTREPTARVNSQDVDVDARALRAVFTDISTEVSSKTCPEDAEPDHVEAELEGDLRQDDTAEYDIDNLIKRVKEKPEQARVSSVPLGKVASRSRLLGYSGAEDNERPQLTGFAAKKMPVRTRPVSKITAKPRARKSRPTATPWSLDL